MTIAGIEMSSITVEFNSKDFARIYAAKIFPRMQRFARYFSYHKVMNSGIIDFFAYLRPQILWVIFSYNFY